MERAAPERTQPVVFIIALGWMLGLGGWHLLHNGVWILPVAVVDLFAHALATVQPGPHLGEFWRARLVDAAMVLGVLAAGFAVGAAVFDRWLPRRDWLTGLLCLGGGLWVLAAATLAVGIVSIKLVPWLFLTLGAWALPAPRRFFRRQPLALDRDGFAIFLWVVIALAALSSLPGTLAPPFEYDELEYHLGALTDYGRAGRIVFLPHNFYSNLPQLTEMLYLLAGGAGSDVAAKLLHWVFGLLTATSLYAVGTRLWGHATGLLAAALFYGTSFVQDLSITARIDLATVFYGTLAFGALLCWRTDDQPEWQWWLGLMAGAAVATKWTAIPVVVLPLLVMLLVSRRSSALITGCCLLVTVAVLPWLAKNWLLAGNPVYPLLNQWFQNPHWTPDQAAVFARRHYPPPWAWAQAGEFFRCGWRYAFDPLQPGPLLLMTAPLVLLVRPADRRARCAGWLWLLGYVGWFCLTFRPWRFLVPLSGLAALLGVYAVTALSREAAARFILRLSLGALLVINVSVCWVRIWADLEDPGRETPRMSVFHLAAGQWSREEWLSRVGGGIFEPILWMNRHLPDGARVLYIGEARLHFTRHAALWSTAFDQHPLAAMMRGAHTPGQLLAELRRQGVTHLYIMPSELERLRKGYGYLDQIERGLVDGLLAGHARAIHVVPTGSVYELAQP